MRLSELFQDHNVFKFKESDVKGLSYDSRRVRPGDLFFAIKGHSTDGHLFIAEAERKGAVALVVERPVKTKLPYALVNNVRSTMAQMADIFYGSPSKHLRVIGVTGTNGKTTTTFMIHHLMKTSGQRGGMIGTVYYDLVGRVLKASHTTPESAELQKMMSEILVNKGHYLVMEVSSHGLCEERVGNVDFDAAVFTNLAREHLDFHGTMEHYWRAKLRLFKLLDGPEYIAVSNVDDSRGREVCSNTKATVTTYGITNPADVQGVIQESDLNGSTLEVLGNYLGEVHVPLPGSHNVYNALAVLALASSLGFSWRCAKEAIETFQGVPGRMERVAPGSPVEIIVDYAHTPSAIKGLLETLRSVGRGRLIVVFGAGGDRDRGKRPEMGHVVEENSDFAFITTDNPRSEDPEKIIQEIRQGMLKKTHRVVLDREEAIFEAVKYAEPGDVVVLIGKGHEDYQIIGDQILPFSDREVARSALRRFWQ